MTIKKTLISVAASALLLAAMTGCSDDDDDNNSNSSSNPTSIIASDGYVLNYTAVAIISDTEGNESNTTHAEIKLPKSVSNASFVDGVQVAGSPVLDLTKDLTPAEIDNLVEVRLSYVEQKDNSGIPGTFFDANSDGKFVQADGDILITDTKFAMTAPAGYKNITPITTLIATRIAALIGADNNESNRSEVEALALKEIAAGLGLKQSDIQLVDPMDAALSNPTYTLINAMLGQAITDGNLGTIATSLSKATAAKDASDALRNIADGAGASKLFYTSTAEKIDLDPSGYLDNVSSMNLDSGRSQTKGGGTSFAPALTTTSDADFNVTAITIKDVNTSILISSGAKVGASYLEATGIKITTADANISNKKFTLAIKVSSQRERMNDAKSVTSLTISVPFEMNNTKGKGLDAAISDNVTWEGIKKNGAFFSGEMNATAFIKATKEAGVKDVPGVETNDKDTLELAIDSIIEAADNNSSNAADLKDEITNISIALVDTDSSTQMVNEKNTNSLYWGNTEVVASGGTIRLKGKSIFKNDYTDMRDDSEDSKVRVNAVPDNSLSFSNIATPIDGKKGTGNTTNPFVFNINTYSDVILSTSTTDKKETNTTVAFTHGSYITDKNSSTLSKALESNSSKKATAAHVFDFNATKITTAGELNTTITTVVTDEFGEANSTKYYFTVNRPFYVKKAAFDGNSSQLLADYDAGKGADANLSTLKGWGISITDSNNTEVNITTKNNGDRTEYNITNWGTNTYEVYLTDKGSLEINEINETALGLIIADINFTVNAINAKDMYDQDFNLSTPW